MKCTKCELHKTSKNQWFPEINENAEVLFLIPSPNQAKFDCKLIYEWLHYLGQSKDKVQILSLLRCPKSTNTTDNSYESCLENLISDLEKMPNLKSIVPMGAKPVAALLDGLTIAKASKKVIEKNGYKLFATYSPSYVLSENGARARITPEQVQVRIDQAFGFTGNSEDKVIKTTIIKTEEELRDLFSLLNGVPLWAYDLETLGVEFGDTIIGISFSCDRHEGYYLPLRVFDAILGWGDYEVKNSDGEPINLIGFCQDILEDTTADKIAQNLKFELGRVSHNWEIETKNAKYDTQVLHYLLNQHSPSHSLSVISDIYPDFEGYKETIKKVDFGGRGWEVVPLEEIGEYGAKDSILTYRYHVDFIGKLSKTLLEGAYQLLVDGMHLVAGMERRGTYIDVQHVANLEKTLIPIIATRQMEMNEIAGYEVNLGSPKQLQSLFYDKDKMALPTKGLKKGKSGFSTDKGTIQLLAKTTNNENLGKVVEFRRAKKAKSVYVDHLNERLKGNLYYANWKLTRTSTGRLASGSEEQSAKSMNLQNIPSRDDIYGIKDLFIAPPGFKWAEADYGQIEVRILAHLTQDPVLVAAMESNFDPHSFNASAILGCTYEEMMEGLSNKVPKYKKARNDAKTIGFGWIYGARDGKFFQEGVFDSFSAEMEAKRRYFDKFKQFIPWKEAELEKLWATGQVESSVTGRVRKFPDYNKRNLNEREKARISREGINTLVQGPASDFTFKAAVELQRLFVKYGYEGFVMNLVHDAIYAYIDSNDVETGVELFKRAMLGTDYYGISINMSTDILVKDGWARPSFIKVAGTSNDYRKKA